MNHLKAMHDAMLPTDLNRKVLLTTLNEFNAFLRRKGCNEFPLK